MNDLGENAIRFSPEISVFSNLGEKQRRFSPKSSKIVYLGEKRDYFSPRFKQNQFFGGKGKSIRKRGHHSCDTLFVLNFPLDQKSMKPEARWMSS